MMSPFGRLSLSVSAIATFAACDRPASSCPAAVDGNIANLLEVAWESRGAGPSWVEYGTDVFETRSTPVVDDGDVEHRVPLYGLPALTDVVYRAVTEADGREQSCSAGTSTLNLPAEMPRFDVTAHDASRVSPEPFLLGSSIGRPEVLFVLDRTGTLLWYLREKEDESRGKTRVDVKFANGSNDLLFNVFETTHVDNIGKIVRIDLGGDEIASYDTPWAHHVFTELPDGTMAFPSVEFQTWHDPVLDEELVVAGDLLLEVAPDRGRRRVFSTFHWLDVYKHEGWNSGFYPDADVDWTHANSLEYYPDTNTYLMSFAHAQSVAEIDRSNGQLLRLFGVDGYGFAPGSRAFYMQHDAHWTERGTLLMTSTDPLTDYMGAIEYEVDDVTRTLTEVREIGFEAQQSSFALGQARTLANGNVLLNWGGGGLIQEITPQGDVVWEVMLGSGTWFGQVRMFSDFYTGQ
jgi:hypothetical protein